LKDKEWIVETKDYVFSSIFNNTKSEIFNYAYIYLINKILDDKQTEEYLQLIDRYNENGLAKFKNFIDVKIKEQINKLHNKMIENEKLENEIENDNQNKMIETIL
jgi:hypothetical protein